MWFQKMLDSLPSQHLPDITASIVKASYSEKVQVLDAVDLTERFKKTLPLLMRQIEVWTPLMGQCRDRTRSICHVEKAGSQENAPVLPA